MVVAQLPASCVLACFANYSAVASILAVAVSFPCKAPVGFGIAILPLKAACNIVFAEAFGSLACVCFNVAALPGVA